MLPGSRNHQMNLAGMLTILSVVSFAIAAAALPIVGSPVVQIPLYYEYGSYPRIQANISWGTPAQASIPTIFDTGSVASWVYGPNSIINDGSNHLGALGPCNKAVENFFNWPASGTHASVVNLTEPKSYSHGNGKIVSAYHEVNDTMTFDKKGAPPLNNTQIAVSNFTLVRQLDDGCKIDANTFDQSILGMAPFGIGGAASSSIGPSFRSNLRSQGKIWTNVLSMWMEGPPIDVKGTYHGTAQFGEPLHYDAFHGILLPIKQEPPKNGYVGYHTALPGVLVNGQEVEVIDSTVTSCLLDSGTGQDILPFKMEDFSKSTGVFLYKSPDGHLIPSWNGSCDSIPPDAGFKVTFPGTTSLDAVVKIPFRSYARGSFSDIPNLPEDICPLNLSLDNHGTCIFGAPFFSAVALQFDDDKGEISIAQGIMHEAVSPELTWWNDTDSQTQ